ERRQTAQPDRNGRRRAAASRRRDRVAHQIDPRVGQRTPQLARSREGTLMRMIIRAILVLVLLVAVGFLALGFWTGSPYNAGRATAPQPVGTAGEAGVQKARERGAEIGEKAAIATRKIEETVEEAALTSKIKAKMVLDDLVKARAIDVTTNQERDT